MVVDPYQRRVKQVLSKDTVTVSATDTLLEALSLMTENRVNALPVVDHRGGCVGILSTTDIVALTREIDEEIRNAGDGDIVPSQRLMEKLSEHDMARHTVGEFMTRQVATVTEEATLIEAASLMLRYQVHRLPVLGKKERLLGIVSTMDILAAFVEGAQS